MQYSQIILNFINDKGISFYKLAKDTGISESTFSKWKNKPTSDISFIIINKIADYFKVSTDCLLGKPEKNEVLFIDFAKRLDTLMLLSETSKYTLSKGIGVSDGLIDTWRIGTNKPTMENIKKLSMFFQVSVEYLLCETDNPAQTNKEPRERWKDEYNYITVMGKNGVQKKITITDEQLIRYRKLLEAGLPEIFNDPDL